MRFLAETRDLCIDGRQFRVWITLPGPSLVQDGYRAIPVDSPLTPDINELDYFTSGDPAMNYVGWASLISRLAQDYPHIVAMGIDDFFSVHNLDTFTPDYIAALESRLKWPSPWLSFVPTVYYGYFANGRLRRDWALNFDSMAFYFTNEKAGISPADETVDNAPGEIADMVNLLADGRKLHVGVYFTTPKFLDDPATPGRQVTSIPYGYDMLTSSLANPAVSGTTAYTGSKLWNDPDHPPPRDCSGGPLTHRLCAVRAAYQ